MQDLRIHFFGGAELYRNGALLPPFPTQKSLSLFAYLVVNRGRLIHRDMLCGQFWGEQTNVEARKALRTCLWRIRSVIEPRKDQRGTLLQVEGSHVRFVASETTWVDAWEFEDAVRVVAPPAQAVCPSVETSGLERAAALYRADFLECVYDDWCCAHRERLRLAYLTVLERLVAQYGSLERWLDVIAWGKQVLSEDPLREHIHRAVIEAHFAKGDRPSALRQYELCVRVLDAELGIEPMEETRQLYERATRRPSPLSRSVSHTSTEPREGGRAQGLVAELDDALSALYALLDRLERTRGALGGQAAVPRLAHDAAVARRTAPAGHGG